MRLTGLERQMLESVYRRETPYVRQDNGEALAVDHAIEHCFVREAVVPERKLVTEALKRGHRFGYGRGCYASGGQSSVDSDRCSRSQDGDVKVILKAGRRVRAGWSLRQASPSSLCSLSPPSPGRKGTNK